MPRCAWLGATRISAHASRNGQAEHFKTAGGSWKDFDRLWESFSRISAGSGRTWQDFGRRSAGPGSPGHIFGWKKADTRGDLVAWPGADTVAGLAECARPILTSLEV